MAIWRAENSILTTRGIEILSKVKAGIGSITVTKVVAGSGRVSESLLSSQTEVSGTTKPMVLSDKESRESGSEISVYIQNEGFTEDFILNQIGVYVMHPDYEDEQLYHISQCEAGGYDTIPAFEDTVTTFGYSLFLEHSNSSSISITVNPQGMIGRDEFEQYKSNLAEELKSVDKGKVSRTLLWERDLSVLTLVPDKDFFIFLFPESYIESGYDGLEIIYANSLVPNVARIIPVSSVPNVLNSSGYLPIPRSLDYNTPFIPFRLTAFFPESHPFFFGYRDTSFLEIAAGSGVSFGEVCLFDFNGGTTNNPGGNFLVPIRIYGIKGTVNEIPSVTV